MRASSLKTMLARTSREILPGVVSRVPRTLCASPHFAVTLSKHGHKAKPRFTATTKDMPSHGFHLDDERGVQRSYNGPL